jgi:hypothetical protein
VARFFPSGPLSARSFFVCSAGRSFSFTLIHAALQSSPTGIACRTHPFLVRRRCRSAAIQVPKKGERHICISTDLCGPPSLVAVEFHSKSSPFCPPRHPNGLHIKCADHAIPGRVSGRKIKSAVVVTFSGNLILGLLQRRKGGSGDIEDRLRAQTTGIKRCSLSFLLSVNALLSSVHRSKVRINDPFKREGH